MNSDSAGMDYDVDPYDWTVQQVIDEVCHHGIVWNARPENSSMPNFGALEKALRANDVDGHTLLNDVDDQAMKLDLGIKSLGHRSNLKYAIRKLKLKSRKYAEENPSPAFMYQTGTPFPPFTPVHGYGSTSTRTIMPTMASPLHPNYGRETPESATPVHHPPTPSQSFLAIGPPPPLEAAASVGDNENAQRDAISSRRRPGEELVEGVDGKKKRRLDLGHVEVLPTAKDAVQGPQTPSATVTSPPSSSTLTTKANAAKISSESIQTREDLCKLKPGRASFLGRSTFNADLMFFDKITYGKPFNNGIDMSPLTKDGEPSDKIFCINASNSRSVPGRQHFVNRKMMYLFNKAQEIDTEDDKTLAFHPYAERASQSADARAIIRIRELNSEVSAVVERARQKFNDGTDSAVSDEWDYLARRWPADQDSDKLLPLYEQSDSEDEDDLSELEQEIEKDNIDEPAQNEYFTVEEVAEIVEEALDDIASKWRERQLPLLKEKALSIWRRGRTAKHRRNLAAEARQYVAQLESRRLPKLKEPIIMENDPGWKRSAGKQPIYHQCENLEVTVEEREKAMFEIAVWSGAQPPPPPTGKVRSRRKQHITTTNNGEKEDILESGDEFIVEDDVDQDYDVFDGPQHGEDVDPQSPGLLLLGSDTEDESEVPSPATAGAEDISGDAMSEDEPTPRASTTSPDSVLDGADKQPSPRVSIKPEFKVPARPQPLVSTSNVIDLTIDSDGAPSPPEIQPEPKSVTSSPRVRNARVPSSTPIVLFSAYPEEDSDLQVLGWDWTVLHLNEDRIRIILRLLRTMPQKAYQSFREDFLEFAGQGTREQLWTLAFDVDAVLQKKLGWNPDFQMAVAKFILMEKVINLYVCWLEFEPGLFRTGYDTRTETFQLVKLTQKLLLQTYEVIQADDYADIVECLGLIFRTFNSHPRALNPDVVDIVDVADIANIDDHDPDVVEDSNANGPSQSSQRKQRKKQIAESQVTLKVRRRVAQNADAWKRREQLFLSQHRNQSSELRFGEDDENVVVNTGKEEDEAEIHIDPKVAGILKPHQVEGIRFMWRELVGTASDDGTPQGCLLAHTMGLGKTLQTIALLSTLAIAVRSRDPDILSQIPEGLHAFRVLILCNAGLVDNWVGEFAQWMGANSTIGRPYVISSHIKPADRPDVLREWHSSKRGGVLIMSYDAFRLLIQNPVTKTRAAPYSEEEHAVIKDHLLKGTSLIVADEAHKFKNEKSSIAQAAKLLDSKSRIALTGSPLSNNLQEYFAMIDWVAPEFLGSAVEFRANFIEPITAGLYGESTPYERRRGRVKLQALVKILEPKVNRKDIETLKGSLKSKTEFVLMIPLTDLQLKMYTAFMKEAQARTDSSTSNARLWAWMSWMQVLCGHPRLFLQCIKDAEAKAEAAERKQLQKGKSAGKDNEPANQSKKRDRSPVKRVQDEGEKAAESDRDQSEDVEDATGTSFAEVTEIVRIAKQIANDFSSDLESGTDKHSSNGYSHRMEMLMQIIKGCRAAGDKILVFSHRIPTLNYIEAVLQKRKIRYARLDGSTKMVSRQGLTKDFNETNDYELMLVSSRAGSTGYNLFGANRVVLFDFHFNPTWEEQAIGRAYRLGQQKPVFVYRLVGIGTFEEALYEQTKFKTQLAINVVEKINTKAKATRLRDYLKLPSPRPAEDLTEFLGKDKIIDGIIGRFEAGQELIQSMDFAETLREEELDQLDDAEQQEVEQLLREEEQRRKDPNAWLANQAARLYGAVPAPSTAMNMPPSAATVLQSPLSRQNGDVPRFSSTAPMGPPPRRTSNLPNPTQVPPQASFGLPVMPTHGLPMTYDIPDFANHFSDALNPGSRREREQR